MQGFGLKSGPAVPPQPEPPTVLPQCCRGCAVAILQDFCSAVWSSGVYWGAVFVGVRYPLNRVCGLVAHPCCTRRGTLVSPLVSAAAVLPPCATRSQQ